jgi:hypothetical protein
MEKIRVRRLPNDQFDVLEGVGLQKALFAANIWF